MDTYDVYVCVHVWCFQERQREEEARKTQEMLQKRRRDIEEAERQEKEQRMESELRSAMQTQLDDSRPEVTPDTSFARPEVSEHHVR